MSETKPVGYMREAGIRSLAEGCHTSLMPSDVDEYNIPLYPASALTSLMEENARLKREAARATAEKIGLLEAIKHHSGYDHGIMGIRSLVDRAQAAEKRVKDAVKVLEPFAVTARYYDPDVRSHGGDDDQGIASYASGKVNDGADHSLLVGHLRAARRFIKEAGE